MESGQSDCRFGMASDVRNQDSRTSGLDVLILGGRPIGEPVVQYGPFVMNTRDEIVQAIADYQSGPMGSIPATHFGAGPR